jgi:nucleotide-binding universal stress UspA family protein
MQRSMTNLMVWTVGRAIRAVEERRRQMFRRILVPTDGSSLSAQAIPVARMIAQAQGASITLVQVITPQAITEFGLNGLTEPEIYEGFLEQEAYQNLAGLQNQLTTSGVHVETHLRHGSAAGALLDYEAELDPNLVVMATHGRTGLPRFALGSVADRLVREGSAPVLLVHAFNAEPKVLEKALVALDGSELSEQALPLVRMLAQRPLRQVRLLRAIARDAEMDAAMGYLTKVGDRLAKWGLGIDLDVRVEEPSSAIQQAAGHTDLVILTTHGRGGYDRWRHGSVAERAWSGAATPILLVRAQVETSEPPII